MPNIFTIIHLTKYNNNWFYQNKYCLVWDNGLIYSNNPDNRSNTEWFDFFVYNLTTSINEDTGIRSPPVIVIFRTLNPVFFSR